MGIQFDPIKNLTNIKKHGISLLEGDGVPDDPFVLVVEDQFSEEEQRFIGLGCNFLGQLRVAVYTYRGDDIRFISVRKPTPKEVKFYEKRI
jgi:uncharacterized protein